MNNRFRLIFGLLLIPGMIGYVAAQQKTSPKKTTASSKRAVNVDTIIRKYVASTGGVLARRKVKSTVIKGTVSIPAQGVNGTIEIYTKAPNKNYTLANITGIGEIIDAFDGTVGWSKSPFTGLREKTGQELKAAKRNSDSDSVANWKKYFAKAEITGSEKVGDSDAYVVKFTTADNKVSTKYFDKKTFFVIREDEIAESPQGTIPTTTYNSDFRTVEGIKVPFEQKQEAGGATIVSKFTEVKFNVPVPDSKFVKPAK